MAGDPDDWPVVIAPDVLQAQTGKTVPLRLGVGGPVVGRATVLDGGRVELTLTEQADFWAATPYIESGAELVIDGERGQSRPALKIGTVELPPSES